MGHQEIPKPNLVQQLKAHLPEQHPLAAVALPTPKAHKNQHLPVKPSKPLHHPHPNPQKQRHDRLHSLNVRIKIRTVSKVEGWLGLV